MDELNVISAFFKEILVDYFIPITGITKVRPNEIVEDLREVTTADDESYLAVLISYPESSLKELRFSRLGRTGIFEYNVFKYVISLTNIGIPFRFEVFEQIFHMSRYETPSIYVSGTPAADGNGVAPSRILIKMQSERRVSIVQFIAANLTIDFTSSQSTDPYLMFYIPPETPTTITASTMITESLKRIIPKSAETNCNSTVELLPSQQIHLVVTLFDSLTGVSTVIIRNLFEFAKFSGSIAPQTATPVERAVYCDIMSGFYPDGPSCKKASSI